MKNLMLRTVALTALVLAPTLASAQGGPGGGPGGPGGAEPGPRGGGGGHMERGGEGPRGGGGGGGERGGGDRNRDRAGDDRGGRDRDRGDRARGDNDRDRGRVVHEREEVRPGRDRDRGPVVREREEIRRGDREGGPRRGARVDVTVQQRERLRGRVRVLGGERIREPDFAVRVGTPIPQRYRFNPLPREIVEVVPEYEGYDYVRVGDQILIIEPGTREIVAVLDD